MSNFDTVVLDGEMGLFTKVREGDLPYYTGATEVTPSDETQTLPTADTIVTSNITVNAIPEEYIDTTDATLDDASLLPSGVTAYADGVKYTGTAAINDDSDLVVSGDTVTVPAGFYEEPAAASVASGSATTPTTSITANPSISVGNDGSITASVSATQSVTPTVSAGYVSSGTAGTITVSGSGSSQLPTQAGATITPSTSQQTAVAAGKFTTGAVVVDKIPSQYIVPTGTKSISANGTGIDVTEYAAVDVAVPSGSPTLETKSVSYTPTESQQTAQITASTGYDGLEEVDITVGAISSSYVGSAIDRRDSTDLSASGATVTAPAGYYESAATKSVASGTAGTPSASKGAVSNHSVSVTPSVTNTAGYISGGTISGTAVTVDVTELESGTKSITENGTGISVSGYSAVDVNVSGGGGNEDAILDGTLENLTNSTVTKLKANIFRDDTAIKTVAIPNVTEILGNAFNAARNLKSVDAPSVTHLWDLAFSGAKRLIRVSFPLIGNYVQNQRLKECTALATCDFGPGLPSLNQSDFENTVNLSELILRRTSSIVTMANTNVFGTGHMTLVNQKIGNVYVPKSLISSYQAASNWSTFYGLNSGIFRGLEDYTVDGTTTGALDYSKIWTAHTPVYTLENESFDGTKVIDSGVQLFDGGSSAFTIVFSISGQRQTAINNAKLLSCHDSNNIGLWLRNNNSFANPVYVGFNPVSSASDEVVNTGSDNYVGFIRSSGLNCLTMAIMSNGETASSPIYKAQNRTGSIQTLSETLLIGGDHVSGVATPQWKGTVNFLKVYKSCLNYNEIVDLLGLED